jgi:hypothetical protein
MLHWRRDAHLEAELVALMPYATCPSCALDLRRMQRIDLASALMAVFGLSTLRARLSSRAFARPENER